MEEHRGHQRKAEEEVEARNLEEEAGVEGLPLGEEVVEEEVEFQRGRAEEVAEEVPHQVEAVEAAEEEVVVEQLHLLVR